MPSWIECKKGHTAKRFKLHDAAIAISEHRQIGNCNQCDEDLRYMVQHVYANDPAGDLYRYEVVKAARLGTRLGGGEDYDPFLLVLREIGSGEEVIWPTFWAPGKGGGARGGQFPPMLSHKEWKQLFSKLGQPIA